MRTLGLEVRYACRSILKRPAMSAIVVVTLALGLGANAAVFSMYRRARAAPVHDAATPIASRCSSYSKADDLNRREAVSRRRTSSICRRQSRRVRAPRGVRSGGPPTSSAGTSPRTCRDSSSRPTSSRCSASSPLPGGRSCPRKKHIGQHRRVVLGHGLWQRRFASDPSIVGRVHRGRWRAVRSRRHRAARLRLSHGLAALGAADVRRRDRGQSPIALHHADRPAGPGTHARRRESADGGRGRTARARPPRDQPRPRGACLHAGARA